MANDKHEIKNMKELNNCESVSELAEEYDCLHCLVNAKTGENVKV